MNLIQQELTHHQSKEKATLLQRFFKTGKGQYAEGDKFIGLTVPIVRDIAKKYEAASLTDIKSLLTSEIHEQRLCGLIILTYQMKKADEKNREILYEFTLKHKNAMNNWDLVDIASPYLFGSYLSNKPRTILFTCASSQNLWDKRIAIISTFWFIRNNDYTDTLKITELLMNDKNDLIHKACGWMLREVGKRDEKVLRTFLEKHARHMPRTMLRYAIERLEDRKKYLEMKQITT